MIEIIIRATLTAAVAQGTPLLLTALGEIMNQRAGVLNLGLDGMMLFGAVTAFISLIASGSLFVAVLVGGICAALLAAMSFVLGKFLQIPNPFMDIVRISFENLPLMIAGICFGPVVGAMTGVVADIVGCLLYGYSINPLITLGAATVGFTAGGVSHYLIRKPKALSIGIAVFSAHLLGSVIVKSFGLAAWYLSKYNMGVAELMGWRLLVYTLTGIAEFTVIFLLLRSRAFCSQLERLVGKK